MTKNNSLSYTKKSPCNKVQFIFNIVFLVVLVYLLYMGEQREKSFAQIAGSSAETSSDSIANWVEKNPNVILASIVKMQQKQYAEKVAGAQKNLIAKADAIYNDKTDPVYNAKNSDITIVEFFDYNCGYCKKASKTLSSLIKKDKKVKIIYKEYPILGKSSEDLATVAIAVNMLNPSKYKAFHESLIFSKVRTKKGAISKAVKLGINKVSLNKILKNKAKEISQKIASNRQLAASVGIKGTPAFIVGKTLIPGAVSLDKLKSEIALQRKNK